MIYYGSFVSWQVCESKLKPLYLVALLQSLGGEKCIVFTSSVESTHRLCTLLNFFDGLQLKIKEYSGLQRQSLRRQDRKIVFNFSAFSLSILIVVRSN